MKKIWSSIKLIIAIAVILAFAEVTVLAATGKSTADFVRIRKGASTNSEVLAVLNEGDSVEILGEEGNWYKVSAKGFTGYVSKDFINKDGASSQNKAPQNNNKNPENNNETGKGNTSNENNAIKTKEYKTKEDVKVYILPLLNSEVIGSIGAGKNLELINNTGIWGYVKSENISGWVVLSKIEVTETEQKAPEEEKPSVEASSNSTVETPKPAENEKPAENTNKPAEQPSQEQNQAQSFKEKTVYVNETAVNIRSKASTNSEVIGSASTNDKYTAVAEENGWYKIKLNNGNFGYIRKDLLSDTAVQQTQNNNQQQGTEEKTMYVNATAVNVRSKASTDSDAIDSVSLNKEFKVVGEENGWYKVKLNNGNFGYIRKDLLSTSKTQEVSRSNSIERTPQTQTTTTTPATSTAQTTTTATTTQTASTTQTTATATTTQASSKVTGQDIVNYAKQFVGCKYVYGAAGPTSFDCSGLVMYVYKHFGYSLSHSSKVQATQGTAVTGDLQPGDILTFSNDGSTIGHVGIYIGNDQFIHASDSTTGVIISNLSSKWNISKYRGARRIIK